MNRVFENVKNSKLITGPKFAFHSPYLDNSECVFSAVLPDRHTFVKIYEETIETDKKDIRSVTKTIP